MKTYMGFCANGQTDFGLGSTIDAALADYRLESNDESTPWEDLSFAVLNFIEVKIKTKLSLEEVTNKKGNV